MHHISLHPLYSIRTLLQVTLTLVIATFEGSKLAIPVVHALCAAYPIKPYSIVHAGPKTHGGGRRGGCRSARYVACVSLGRVEKPIAVPAAMGRRMAAAGFSKMEEGRVREGM